MVEKKFLEKFLTACTTSVVKGQFSIPSADPHPETNSKSNPNSRRGRGVQNAALKIHSFISVRFDTVPDQVVTYQTPSFLHPNLQTERHTFHTIDKGQYRGDTQLCMWSF